MSIGTIPDWLSLPNFIQAMREGAQTGLAARQQDTEEAQAADKMQLAYEQLAEKERASNALTQYRLSMEKDRQERAADALKQRVEQAKALQDYRQQDIEARQETAKHAADALGETIRHNRATETRLSNPSAGTVTITDKIPGTDPVPGVPAVVGGPLKMGWWGNKPAIPAVPGTPGRTISRKMTQSAADALLGGDSTESFPPAPSDPKDRETNKTYSLPKGTFTWTGKGWRKYSPSVATSTDETESTDGE